VARATPQGALSLPREAKRLTRTPSVVKTSTKPSPGPATTSFFWAFCFA
jgi:hypothetical protein